MSLVYNEEAHEYHLDGKRLVSNTEIMAAAGFSDYSGVPSHLLDAAAAVGKAVHKATYLLDKKRDWSRYKTFAGYVEAWMQFKADYKFKPTIREKPMVDPEIGVATCPDAFGESKEGLITVQIKTCPVKPYVALQTSFEERVIGWTLGSPLSRSTPNRFGVELREDGTYKPTRFAEPGFENDIKVWMAAYTVQSWLWRHNGRK